MTRKTKVTVEGWRPGDIEKKAGVAIDIDSLDNPERDFIYHLRAALGAILSHEMKRQVDRHLDDHEIQMDREALYDAVGAPVTGHEISFPAIGELKPKPKPGTIRLELLKED